MSLGFSFENSELDWDKVRWMEELLTLKEAKLKEVDEVCEESMEDSES